MNTDDAIDFECACGTRLRAAAKSAGRSVRCPSCQSAVAVPEQHMPFEVVVEYEPSDAEVLAEFEERQLRKRKRAARERQRGLNGVQTGLTLLLLRLVVSLLGIPVIALALVSFLYGRFANPAYLLSILVTFAVVPPILGLAGALFCLRVPLQANARGHMLMMMVVDVAAIVGHAAVRWLGLSGASEVMAALLLNVLPLASWAFLMLFLRGLAEYLGRAGSAYEAESLLVSGLIILGTRYYWLVIVRGLVAVLFCFGLLVAIGLFIWLTVASIRLYFRYYNLLVDLRDAVA